MRTIIRSPEGTGRREVEVATLQVPDLWHVASYLEAQGKARAAKDVLECWHLCHDLLWNIREYDRQLREHGYIC